MPEISVLIPTRNRKTLLRRTLASVLRQRGVDLDVIVVDDESTDGTAAMVLDLCDSRVRVLRQAQRAGVSAARNRGVEESSGEWVAFLDDDDLWAPHKLVKQLRAAETLSRGWAYGGAVAVTPELRIVAGGHPPSAEAARQSMALRNMVPAGASNVLVHRRVLEQAGRFDTRLRHMSDWDMWIRLAQIGLPAVVAEPILAYVLHRANASTDTDDAPAEMFRIEERYRHLRNQPTLDRAYIYRWMAWHYLRSRQRLKALKAYRQAVACGDTASLGRAAVGMLWPGVIWAGTQWRGHPSHEAASWLRDFAHDDDFHEPPASARPFSEQ